VEQGKRAVRLAESLDLAEVLGLSTSAGLTSDGKGLRAHLILYRLAASKDDLYAVTERVVREQVKIAVETEMIDDPDLLSEVLDELRWTVVDMAEDQFRTNRARLAAENHPPIVAKLLEAWNTIEANREKGKRFDPDGVLDV
jgi:hypothetical protein